LRNPDAKRFVWDDVKLLLAEMKKAEGGRGKAEGGKT
jgi:hypothetical protein